MSSVKRAREYLDHGDAVIAAVLLGYAALGKLTGLTRFTVVLMRIFPLAGTMARYSAVGVLMGEAGLCICLLLHPADRWHRRYAAALFAAFAIVHFVILAAGSRIMECGCFGALQGTLIASMFDTPEKALVLNAALALALMRFDLIELARSLKAFALPIVGN